MKDVSFTVKAGDTSVVRTRKSVVSLRAEGLSIIVLPIIPIAIAGYVIIYLWQTPGAVAKIFFGILSEQLSIGSVNIPVAYIAFSALLVFAWFIGSSAFNYLCIRPIRTVTTWLKQARDSDFKNIPILPPLRRDEFGELMRLVSSSASLFSQTKDQNTTLAQEKSLFITVASHQLRTPLTGLLWSIDSLLDPATDEGARQKLMTDVDGLLKRMRLIVNHILASSNVEEGKFGYVFEKTDIVPIIAKLVEDFKPVSDSRGVTLALEGNSGNTLVYVDTERISLALFDLISNAIDYTPRGGTVTISTAPQQDGLEVAIVDTGMGISESEIPHLFSKFYRGERARHVRPDGSGLGLYLVKEIISSHGSDIKVTSKEGVGSRFSIILNSKKPG